MPGDTAAVDPRSALRAIARGDQGAMERLYDLHSPRIMALALRILGNREQAEELVTDVFMELWNRVERFDLRRCSLTAHLLALCHARAIDRLRVRNPEGIAPIAHSSPGAADATSATGATSTPSHSTALDPSSIFAQLAPEERLVLELAYFDAGEPTQIAQRLGQTPESVNMRLRHGLIQLRDRYRAQNAVKESAAQQQEQSS